MSPPQPLSGESCIRRECWIPAEPSIRRKGSDSGGGGVVVGGVVGVVGVVVVPEARQGEVVVGCSFCVVMGATRKSFYNQKRFHGSIFFDPLPPNIFHGRSFLPIATSSSKTLRNRHTRKTLHGGSFSSLETSDAHY